MAYCEVPPHRPDLAWHLPQNSGRLRFSNETVELGRTYYLEGGRPPRICTRGYHASQEIVNALGLGYGTMITRVACWGDRDLDDKKASYRYRRVIGILTPDLGLQAYYEALSQAEERAAQLYEVNHPHTNADWSWSDVLRRLANQRREKIARAFKDHGWHPGEKEDVNAVVRQLRYRVLRWTEEELEAYKDYESIPAYQIWAGQESLVPTPQDTTHRINDLYRMARPHNHINSVILNDLQDTVTRVIKEWMVAHGQLVPEYHELEKQHA